MTAPRKSTPAENDAALALIGVIEARLHGDQNAANVILDPLRDDLAPVLQFAVEMLASLVVQCTEDPRIFLGSMRSQLLNGMANPS